MDTTHAEISKIVREVNKLISKTLSIDGIGPSEFDLIHVVRKHNGITQSEICEILGSDKGAVARQVKVLEKKGYLVKKESRIDKRCNLIYATEKANELKVSKRRIESIYYQYLLDGLNEDEKKEFSRLLEKVYLRSKSESKNKFINVKKRLEGDIYEEK